MGLKKYEIITVGSDKRVRALRSWQVGDRYVNIGDVGGIVYDEKTLSQDGLCWLFRGNFNFPGARIGGDSIVDVGEAALSATGAPNVDIIGSSVVVGSKLQFASRQTAADAVVLSESFFEQGSYEYVRGIKWEDMRTSSPNYIRTKSPIFVGGVSKVLKCGVAGYLLSWYALDRDGVTITASATVTTGEGVTATIVPCQYFLIRLTKNPAAATVPADAAAAALTFTGTYETKLSIIDSRVEINPATSTGTTTIRPGGVYTITSGAKYPDSVIQNSKVSMMVHAASDRTINLMAEFINTSAVIDASVELAPASIGIYKNVKNLAFSGAVTGDASVSSFGVIQATDCDNFAVSSTIFPGLAAAKTANMPFIFQGCNVPNGIFYHHAQIANTYKNIDFAKASVDLGKSVPGVSYTLVSSETEGMYRIYNTAASLQGFLVESYDSISSIGLLAATATSYGTTIYKDAYVSGKFDFAGTNMFGHKVRSHPLAQVLNVQPRVVQGNFNSVIVGNTITGVVPDARFCVIPTPLRVNGSEGITIQGLPGNLKALAVFVTPAGVIRSTDVVTNDPLRANNRLENMAYIRFGNADNSSPITPEDLAGVTVTVYNGCKIVNTGTKAVNMKGNIRVEDNATLINASVTGSGYFGGNSVAYYNPAVWASLDFNGTVYMKDDTIFAPSALTGASALVRMEGNAKFTGSVDVASTNLSFIMRDNAVIEGKANTRSGVVMSGNSKVTATGQITAASRGVLVMEENASIEANTTVIGAITLSGNYKGNVVKTWTGKRTITDVNAPEYDNNVKTQYDF